MNGLEVFIIGRTVEKENCCRFKRILLAILVVALVRPVGVLVWEKCWKGSHPGKYRGYSYRKCDGWNRPFFYVTVHDETKLAVDLFRPLKHGRVEDEPLPDYLDPFFFLSAIERSH